MSMNEYQKQKQKLKQCRCKTCGGTGQQDDCHPGDIGYNKWTCTVCKGAGLVIEDINVTI